jgi:hypothetical protein
LEATLVIEPLIGEALATVHTPDRNDHLATCGGCLLPVVSTQSTLPVCPTVFTPAVTPLG